MHQPPASLIKPVPHLCPQTGGGTRSFRTGDQAGEAQPHFVPAGSRAAQVRFLQQLRVPSYWLLSSSLQFEFISFVQSQAGLIDLPGLSARCRRFKLDQSGIFHRSTPVDTVLNLA